MTSNHREINVKTKTIEKTKSIQHIQHKIKNKKYCEGHIHIISNINVETKCNIVEKMTTTH